MELALMYTTDTDQFDSLPSAFPNQFKTPKNPKKGEKERKKPPNPNLHKANWPLAKVRGRFTH